MKSIKDKVSFSSIRNKEDFENISSKLKPDDLIDNLNEYKDNEYVESIITANIDNTIKNLIEDNPKASKQQLIETLIQNNPENKEKVLSVVSKTMNDQIETLKNKYSEKEFNKLKKVFEREDLKEIQSLAENRTEDQIRALKSVNKAHW